MTSTSVLLIIVGIFIIVNTVNGNLVGVVNGTKQFNVATSATATPGQTPVVNAATGVVTGTKSVSGG